MFSSYYLEKEARLRVAEHERRLREAELARALAHPDRSGWRRWASAAGDVLIRLGWGLKQRVAVPDEPAPMRLHFAGRGQA